MALVIGAFGERTGLLLGGVARQHLTSNQAARKQSPPMDGKDELIGRLWEGQGLFYATSRGIKGRAAILWVSTWQFSSVLPALLFLFFLFSLLLSLLRFNKPSRILK